MADIVDYNVPQVVPPQQLAMPNYNMSQYINNLGAANVRHAPIMPLPDLSAQTTATPEQNKPKLSAWDNFLQANKDAAVTPEGYDGLVRQFKLSLEPTLYANKMTKDGVEAALRLFDDKARRGRPGGTAAGSAPNGELKDNANLLSENVAAFGGGVAQIVPGLGNLADVLYRDARGVVRGIKAGANPFTAEGFREYGLGEKTALGAASDRGSENINEFVRGRTTNETLAQIADIQAKLAAKGAPDSKMAGYLDTIGEYLDPDHWRATGQQVSTGASTLVPMSLTAKALARAGALTKATGTAERILRAGAPTGAVFGGQAVSDFENKVRSTPIAQIITDNPELAAVYKIAQDGSTPAEAEKQIKDSIVSQGAGGTFASSFIANTALTAIPGLRGAERVAANVGNVAARVGSRGVNALKSGASDFAQETLAGLTEGTGANIAMGRPAFEGGASAAAIGGIAGAAAGGTLGALEGQQKKSLKKQITNPAAAASTTAQEAAGTTAAQTATPAADRGQDAFSTLPDKPMAASGFATVAEKFGEALAEQEGAFKTQLTNKKTKTLYDADALRNKAEKQAQKIAGTSWDKLDAEQRVGLVEAYLRAASTKVEIPKLDDFLTAYKAERLPAVAPVVAPAPAVQETPLPAEVAATGVQVPGTVAADATPAATAAEVIAPAPVVTPAPQKAVPQGKLERVPLEEAAKGPDGLPKESAVRKTYLNEYLNNLLDKGTQDLSNDPRFAVAKAAVASGMITTPGQLDVLLTAEAKQMADTEAARIATENDAVVTVEKGDNRVVGVVTKQKDPKTKRVRDQVKEMGRVLAQTKALSPNEIDALTVKQLREEYLAAVKGAKATETKPAKRKLKAKKKADNVPATSRPNNPDMMPAGKNKERKTTQTAKSESGSSYGSAVVKSLVADTFKKGTGAQVVQARVLKWLERIEAQRAIDPKGIPSDKTLGDYTYDELEAYVDSVDVQREFDRKQTETKTEKDKLRAAQDKKKAENLAKQQALAPTERERGLTLINDLHTELPDTVSAGRVPKTTVTALQTAFDEAVKSGKLGKLDPFRKALLKANVFGAQIDKIIKAAKTERAEQLERFNSFKDYWNDPTGVALTNAKQNQMLTAFMAYVDGGSKSGFKKAIKDITGRDEAYDMLLLAAESEKKQRARGEEEPTPPKTPAPLIKGANSKKARSSKSEPKLTVAQQISARFTELSDAARGSLVSAVELAQQGDDSVLKEFISDNLETETITKDDATTLRKMATEAPRTTRELTREQIEQAKADIQEAEQADADAELDMLAAETLRMDMQDALGLQPRPISASTQTALNQLEAEFVSSDTVLKALGIREKPAVKGTANILARLRELRRNPELRESADFAIWLLEANPHVARTLGLTTRNMQKAGGYNPMQLMAYLNESKAPARAVVHEVLHHMERMMPYKLQQRIRAEYSGRLANKFKQVKREGTPDEVAFIRAVYKSIREPSEANTKTVKDFLTSGKVNIDEFYKYVNPSEYWAETASEILGRKYKPDSWKAALKEWVNEFIQKLAHLFGWENESEIYAGLREVLEGRGAFRSNQLLRQGSVNTELSLEAVAEASDEMDATPPASEVAVLKDLDQNKNISQLQRFWETAAKATQGIMEAEIDLFNKGVRLEFDELMSTAISAYRGAVSWNNRFDINSVVAPVKSYIAENYSAFAQDGTFETAMKNINMYFGNKHLLERNRMQWALGVPLSGGRESDRDDVLDEWKSNELTSVEAKLQLVGLAQKYGQLDMRDFTINNGMSEATFEAIGRTLETLANEEGMTDSAMEELNDLMTPVRDRLTERMIESGRVAKDDKWIELYDFKYYVPLKGGGKPVDPALDDFSYINESRAALAKMNASVAVMDGRVTFAEDPFTRLFVDLARSGERAAFKDVAKRLYLLATEHKKELGAHISVWKGTPKDGYTNGEVDASGELKVFRKMKGTQNAIVYNDGRTHYVINLPSDSQMLRGLTGMNAVKPPNIVLRKVGVATNFLGRAYTTLSPMWNFALGFVRDWTSIPFSIATLNYDNPLQAAAFVKNYPLEMLKLYRVLPSLGPIMTDNIGELIERAKNDPTGYAADAVDYLQSGGSNDFTQGFELKKAVNLFKGDYSTSSGLWEDTKITANMVFEYTGNWANFLELMTRVAAFKALKASDPEMTSTEAAVKVRQVLDYSESGTQGRNINSMTAFYRTGMTSADTFVRAFRGKDGKFDKKKFGIWFSTYSGMGIAAFLTAAATMGDDDEKDENGNTVTTPIINKIKLQSLTQNIPIKIGDKVYGLKLGLGMPQVMMAPGILAGAYASGHSTLGEVAGELWNVFNRNGPNRVAGMRGTVTDPTNVLASVIASIPFINPTVAAPIIAASNNLDTFGQPIHRETYDKTKPKYGQAAPNTPKQYVEMAQAVYKSTGVDMFPEDLRYLAVNYGGQNMADLLKATIDLDNKNLFGEDAHYNPLTSRFEIKDLDYYASNDMYDTMDAIGQLDRKHKEVWSDAHVAGKSNDEAKRLENEARAQNPAVLAAVTQAKQIKKLIDKRKKELGTMRTDKTLSDARRQAQRKLLDSELRQATLKAKYLLEKAQ